MSEPETKTVPLAFCPSCGQKANSRDRFCGQCGRSLSLEHPSDATATKEEPALADAERRTNNDDVVSTAAGAGPPVAEGGSRRALKIGVAVAALVLALGAAVVLFVAGGSDAEQDPAAAAREADIQAFMNEMRRRDSFFALERRYRAAMGDTYAKLREWRSDDRAFREETKRIEEEFADEWDTCFSSRYIPCPNPTYPDPAKVPSFSSETKRLRAVADDVRQLGASLAAVTPRQNVSLMHAQLMSATEEMEEEARHNADVLSEAVVAPVGEAPGEIDQGKIETMRAGSALPAIKQMNRIALKIVDQLELRLSDFDLPGGRDLDTEDHSDEL